MPKFLPKNIEEAIKEVSKNGDSYSIIKKKLKQNGHNVSIATISRVNNDVGIRREAINSGLPAPKFRRPPIKRTPGAINKVKRLSTGENPATQKSIRQKTGLSRPTISKIIHDDLGLVKRKKAKVDKLTPEHKKNRKTNCRKLYENHLAGDRSKYAVTLDEAMVYNDDANGKREICYLKPGETVPKHWVIEKDERFKHGFMLIGIISGKGTLPLMKVPTEVKINARYYVDYVLKPLFTIHLPRLYGNEMNKVFFHHDKASSHTARLTVEYLEKMKKEIGISYLENSEIPVKAPDASPLDFFGFGYLKQQLLNRRAVTLDGIWKVAQEIWCNIDEDMVKRVFASWKYRCRLISRNDGAHIENTKSIHQRTVNDI